MINSQAHPVLKRSPLQEALLEIRYKQPKHVPYGIVPGRLYEGINHIFNGFEELPTISLPLDFPSDVVIVRHRFITSEKSRLIQLGQGVLTINHIKYSGFEDFMQDCKLAIDQSVKIGLFSEISRIGLRYINKVSIDRPIANILSFPMPIPNHFEGDVRSEMHQWHMQMKQLGTLSTTVAYPSTDPTPMLVLDLDHHQQPLSDPSSTGLLNWVELAHQNIYTCFKGLFCPEYFNYMQVE